MAAWEFTYDGYTWGPGHDVTIMETEGLDLPEIRSSDQDRPGQHGAFSGRDLAGGRVIRQTLQIHETDAEVKEAILADLNAALQPRETETALTFTVDGRDPERILCRPRRRRLRYDRMTIAIGRPLVDVEWFASDPRIYSDTQSSGSTGLPEASGGMTFDTGFAIVFGSVGSGGQINATNSGSTSSPWTATVTGPVSNPAIESVTAGKTVTFELTVNSGETLEIDSANRSVLLNGTASRYSSLATDSQWFDLLPGSNEIRFLGTSGTGSLQLFWRSARL